MNDKILPTHLRRRATVYLRQSTLKQVFEHRESTARQYALRTRALDLGWSDGQVDLIDDDLGQSGSSTNGRVGFQRLAEDVAHGRVGAIFALEVSRLARCSADWHRLLDLCGLADVVIADEQAVYTPRDYNDRLLLGLKGQMSEAELYWMRLRLQGARLSKARRGELFMPPPSGYLWDEANARFRLDPEEQVQRAIRLVFERFRLDGSAGAVARYFWRNGLTMPARDQATQELRWGPARDSLILNLLHNPAYAGAYVWGRREERIALVNGELQKLRYSSKLPMEQWKACLPDRHPAYISWDEFMANQTKLTENRCDRNKAPEQRGAARKGPAMVQGLVLCGRCGHRMFIQYWGTTTARDGIRRAQYVCRAAMKHRGEPQCWSVSAEPIDEAVVKLFLEVVQPPEIELGLAVAREAERQTCEVDRQWKLRLERLRYEARLAERRYKAIDPDNRSVGRTLERDWNDKLRELEQVEGEYQAVRRREKLDLSKDDRDRILSLSRDLVGVWNADTTTNAERKNLVRMLVREVTLTPVDIPERRTRLQVLWHTGAITDFTIPRVQQHQTSFEAVNLLRELAATNATDQSMAEELNRRGLTTGFGHPWQEKSVKASRQRLRIYRPGRTPGRQPPQRSDGLYSTRGVATRFGVTVNTVRYWVVQGWLTAIRDAGRCLWFELDSATIARLEDAKARGYGYGRPRQHHRCNKEVHCA